MNLYLVERDDWGYDEYDGFVVAANTEEEAMALINKEHDPERNFSDWPNVGNKTIEKIGTTDSYTEPEIILDSFNAG
jgi:hypothetical protein